MTENIHGGLKMEFLHYSYSCNQEASSRIAVFPVFKKLYQLSRLWVVL